MTRTHYHVNREKLHHLVATYTAKFYKKIQNFPVLLEFSLCKKLNKINFMCFSLSGKVNIQIPCFPCAVATLCYLIMQHVHVCCRLLLHTILTWVNFTVLSLITWSACTRINIWRFREKLTNSSILAGVWSTKG